jgi:putative flippase GtrA
MKFVAVGAVNFLVDYGVLTLLNVVLGWPLVLSNIISYSCGVINSFLLNRYWTFKMKLSFFKRYSIRLNNRTVHPVFVSFDFLKFIFVNLVSLGVNTLAVYILGDLYGLPTIFAKLIATAFSFIVNFAGNKLLVFKDKPAENVQE